MEEAAPPFPFFGATHPETVAAPTAKRAATRMMPALALLIILVCIIVEGVAGVRSVTGRENKTLTWSVNAASSPDTLVPTRGRLPEQPDIEGNGGGIGIGHKLLPSRLPNHPTPW